MNKKRLVLLIGLLIIVVIGGVSIYTNYSKKYSTSVDQQANLKTYANRKAEFSVQYSIEYQDSVGDDFLTLDDKKIFKTNDDCADRPNFRVELFIAQTKENSAKEIARKRQEDDKTWEGEIIKQYEMLIGDVPASVTEWRLGKCQDGISIDIVHNNYHIEINKYPPNGSKNEFAQILSTFKFNR